MAASLVAVAVYLTATWPATLLAQAPDGTFGGRQAPGPAWTAGWSALAAVADLPRGLPQPPAPIALLRLPRTPTGLFWTAANPAGLPLEIARDRGELGLRSSQEEGPHHRPLETDRVDVVQLSGFRWQRLGEGAALAGRVLADRTETSAGSFSPAVTRYGSDPFVLTDTTITPMRHIRVRLDGAYGLRRGSWLAGLGLALQVSDDRTVRARLPRLARSSLTGATLGVGRTFAGEALTVSLYGRWNGGTESARLIAAPAVVGVVYPVTGYAEPDPIRIHQQVFAQHIERSAGAGGVSAAGRVGALEWAGFAERGSRRHRHVRSRRAGEPADEWQAEGWRVGGAVVAELSDRALQAVVSGSYLALEGDAFRRDLDGSIFRAHESLVELAAELRYLPAAAWSAAGVGTFRREARVRRDFLANLSTDIASWTPGFWVEVAHSFDPRFRISVGGGAAFPESSARIPDPSTTGPVYQRLIAPELAAYTAAVTPAAGNISLRRDLGSVGLLLSVDGWRRAGAADPRVTLATGEPERSSWSISLTGIWDR